MYYETPTKEFEKLIDEILALDKYHDAGLDSGDIINYLDKWAYADDDGTPLTYEFGKQVKGVKLQNDLTIYVIQTLTDQVMLIYIHEFDENGTNENGEPNNYIPRGEVNARLCQGFNLWLELRSREPEQGE